jgi:hypothetical protein
MSIESNIGSADRALRIGAGAALIGLALAALIGPWGYVGVVVLATGLFRFCPAYRLFGLSTCSPVRR